MSGELSNDIKFKEAPEPLSAIHKKLIKIC